MTKAGISRTWGTILLTITICMVSLPVQAKYSGGTGEPNDPYQVATAADLILLGETPEDYDKHFILTADIDLDPNLPGRKVFDGAVIAPDMIDQNPDVWFYVFDGRPFSGVFDGNGHTISNFTCECNGAEYVGLFGFVGGPKAEIRDLGLIDPSVEAVNADLVAPLVGHLEGLVKKCRVEGGSVAGTSHVGGLVGQSLGIIRDSYAAVAITAQSYVGGLVGQNGDQVAPWAYYPGTISNSYSAGTVSGDRLVGGLVGWTTGRSTITNSYSSSTAIGKNDVGGLVGDGFNVSVTTSFWDVEASGQTASDGGTGKTTTEMQTASTFLDAGWDFVGETDNGPNDVWKIVEGQTYPLLSWQKYGGGTGEPNDPYLIYTAEHLNELGAEPNDYDKHFKLMADIDLSGYLYDRAVIAPDVNDTEDWFQGTAFTGVFDGDNHTILHVTITGVSHLGLIGQLEPGAMITNVGLEAVDVNGTGEYIGGLVGYNGGSIRGCSSIGRVSGRSVVGGCVGQNGLIFSPSHMTSCYSNVTVTGQTEVGGLVGCNLCNITTSYSTGEVDGVAVVGGLVGSNLGLIANSCSVCSVFGHNRIGGFIGSNGYNPRIDTFLGPTPGSIANCYSAGSVSGMGWSVGGFVGENSLGEAMNSFWDMETSSQTESDGGTGLTTTEMQTAGTFLEAGWDFVGETANGTEDIWWIDEGQGYPRLWWELIPEN